MIQTAPAVGPPTPSTASPSTAAAIPAGIQTTTRSQYLSFRVLSEQKTATSRSGSEYGRERSSTQ